MSVSKPSHPRASAETALPRAIVYCEANFGDIDGKTANGLVRHSERDEIVSVIDRRLAGEDSGMVLDGRPNGIPLCADLASAMKLAGGSADLFIVGVAPTSGLLSVAEREVLLDAMSQGLGIINGLHEFLNDDPEFAAAAIINGVEISDIRHQERRSISLRCW